VPPNQTVAEEVEFEVGADPSIPANKKGKGGRPLKMTGVRFNRILTNIRSGLTNHEACRVESVCYTTWRLHLQQNSQWRTELGEAERVRDEVWRDRALAVIRDAMPKNWVAAMTFLERKWPNEYALRTVVRNLNSTEAPLFERVSATELVENARLAATAALNPPPGLVVNREAATADSGNGVAA